MNQDVLRDRWAEISDRIHGKWSRISKGDIQSLNGNLDALVGKICKVYGCPRGRAERDYHEFRLSLRSMLHPFRPVK